MSKNKTKIALIISSAFYLFKFFLHLALLCRIYLCTICTACWDKEFMKMSVNSAPERSEDLNVALKFICILEGEKKKIKSPAVLCSAVLCS